jgi:hypothetical protein
MKTILLILACAALTGCEPVRCSDGNYLQHDYGGWVSTSYQSPPENADEVQQQAVCKKCGFVKLRVLD